MAQESFATGANLGTTGDPLYDLWAANIQGGVSKDKINDPNQEKFDVLRGWPIEGAITNFIAPEAYPDDDDDTVTEILRGQFVTYSTAQVASSPAPAQDGDKLKLADSPDLTGADPIKIMCALDSTTSTTVIAAGSVPVLSTNYVVRTDQIKIGESFSLGDPVASENGLVINANGTDLQVVGTVTGQDTSLGTVDIEVN